MLSLVRHVFVCGRRTPRPVNRLRSQFVELPVDMDKEVFRPPLPLASLMDLLLDAICVVNTRGRFVSITGACESIFGYPSDEMVGQPMIDFVFHEDRARTLAAVERVEAGHRQLHFENRYVRKDGSIVDIMWSAAWSEALQVRVGVARDITVRPAHGAHPHPEDEPPPRWRLSESPRRLTPPGHSPIELSVQDYKVLLALATGACVRRETIVRALGQDYLVYDQRRLDTQMRRLRRKVEETCGLPLPINTVRNVGYHFYDELSVCR
jgi:PAS domain S-box-containing protein